MATFIPKYERTRPHPEQPSIRPTIVIDHQNLQEAASRQKTYKTTIYLVFFLALVFFVLGLIAIETEATTRKSEDSALFIFIFIAIIGGMYYYYYKKFLPRDPPRIRYITTSSNPRRNWDSTYPNVDSDSPPTYEEAIRATSTGQRVSNIPLDSMQNQYSRYQQISTISNPISSSNPQTTVINIPQNSETIHQQCLNNRNSDNGDVLNQPSTSRGYQITSTLLTQEQHQRSEISSGFTPLCSNQSTNSLESEAGCESRISSITNSVPNGMTSPLERRTNKDQHQSNTDSSVFVPLCPNQLTNSLNSEIGNGSRISSITRSVPDNATISLEGYTNQENLNIQESSLPKSQVTVASTSKAKIQKGSTFEDNFVVIPLDDDPIPNQRN